MISITCTNCRANLTIDDAFAGGVCRCQYCGTIQTVPAKSRATAPAAAASNGGGASAAPSKPAPPPAAPKALYQNKARVRQATGATTDIGLDDLANAVHSSGLTGSGLASRRHTAPTAAGPGQPTSRKLLPILLIACGVIIVLLGVILFVVLSAYHKPATGSGNATGGGTTPAATASSDFCGIPLHSNSTIFLIDRGNSISEQFDAVKAACFKAIDAFGPGRKFQVILWDNDSSPAEFPSAQMADATTAQTDALHHYFQDTIASGRSRLGGVLKEAIARNPQEIVIVTGKGADDLSDDDAAVLQSMIGKNIRINIVQVYPVTPSPNPTLQETARATGGQYRNVSAPQLRDFAH
ncbi:MAG TPA: hypothetical protein VGI81_15230 [Tepidisphaeraceae bacterium]|jgi:hypothetical protein